MPCQILVAATSTRKQIKGEVIAIKDEPAVWGGREKPPDYAIIKIPDANASEVTFMMTKRTQGFNVTEREVLGQKELTITIKPSVLSEVPRVSLDTQIVRDTLEEKNGIVKSQNPSQIVVSFGSDVTKEEILDIMIDRYEEKLGPRFLVPENNVNSALVSDLSLNIATLTSQKIDRQ